MKHVLLLTVLISFICCCSAQADTTPVRITTQARLDSVFAIVFGIQGTYTKLAREILAQVNLDRAILYQIDSLFMLSIHKRAQDSIRVLGLVNPGSGTNPDTLILLYGKNELYPANTNLGGWVYSPRYLLLKPNSPTVTNIRAKRPGEK